MVCGKTQIYNNHITMEQLFDQLQRFMVSPNCIFDFKPIDYPTALQQHLINSYFQLNSLLKSTPHSDIVRLLHSPQRQFQIFIPGLLYSMFLDFNSSHQLFQTYMPILRTQSWLSLDRLLQQLIKQSFSIIKLQHRIALVSIIAKLQYFGQLSGELIVLALKTIDLFDLTQPSLNYNNNLLQFIQTVLCQQQSQNNFLKQILAENFFYKLLRMLTLLNLVNEETMREYKNRCISIAYRLFQLNKSRCMAMGWAAAGIMRELQAEEPLQKLLDDCRQELRRFPSSQQNPINASLRLGMVLPMRVQATLKFIIQQSISQLQLGLQMNWVFTKSQQHYQLLLIDILRYVLAQPLQQMSNKQGTYLLEWLFYRSCSNNILFQFWKSQLFHPCFCQPCPYPAAPERALRFLAYLLQNNFEFGQTLLIYLLRQLSIPSLAKRLKQLLLQANSLRILDLQMLLNHSRLSARAKTELRAAIGDNSFEQLQKFKEEDAQPYYNPLQLIQQKSEMQVQFSPSESSQQHFAGYEQQQSTQPKIKKQQTKGFKVRLQKMFAQDLGDHLTQLMQDPNLPNYKEFFRKLMDQIKTFKLNGQIQTIQLFIVQTTKITYLLFQNQFQNHHIIFPREQNVIVYLLTHISSQWRTNSLVGQCCKKILRKIYDIFPTAEPGIWRQFLLYFRRGVIPTVRQIRDWLIPKQKSEYAIALLRQLGPINKQIIDNAELLKLPLG